MKRLCCVLFVAGALLCGACGGPPKVLKQDIPVSTNPLGAEIYVDGTRAGKTPGVVSLERSKDHIVTLTKDNFRQADVTVKRKYKETSMVDAINNGVRAGVFHGNVSMGVSNALGSMSHKEKTGEMFVLTPSVIKVTLAPLSGAAGGGASDTRVTPGDAAQPAGTEAQTGESDPPEPDKKALAKDLLKAGAAAEATRLKPVEKRKTLDSSSKEYRKSDGTLVREKKKTSVGVSVNPSAVVLDVLDKLFK